MSYKPILFSTMMVQAILDERKTVTRRVIKAPVLYKVEPPTTIERKYDMFRFVWESESTIGGFAQKPPYDIGDILWVRETWQEIRLGDGKRVPYSHLRWYKADDESENPDNKWRPSIYMPKVYARLFLRVIGVRVERLQDITEADAKAEGAEALPGYCDGSPAPQYGSSYRLGFSVLWDSLNAKRDSGIYAWEKNPWVFAYTFERCEKPEGWCV